jgi:molybdate transport system permease protein
VAAAGILGFARALGEFGATAVLAGNIEGETRTLALAVYALLDAPEGDPTMRWLVGASLLLAGVALTAYEGLLRWQRRRLDVGRGR